MIFLFTDFGAADIYVGQVRPCCGGVRRAFLSWTCCTMRRHSMSRRAPISSRRSRRGCPKGGVVVSVVDPGVGGPRDPVAVLADGRWFRRP